MRELIVTNLLIGNSKSSLTILIRSSAAETPLRTFPNAVEARKTNQLHASTVVGLLSEPKRLRPFRRMSRLH